MKNNINRQKNWKKLLTNLFISKLWISIKIGLMLFFGYFILSLVRYNLSVHIIDMAQMPLHTAEDRDQQKTYADKPIFRYDKQYHRTDKIFVWDDMRIGRLLAAYHIGFCICLPIIYNCVGDKLGPTWLVGISSIMSGILNCLTPASTYYDYWTVFVVRMFMGSCAGAMQISMARLLQFWVPPIERNYFLWSYCGNTMGTFSTFIYCTFIQYYFHWPVGFYAAGIFQIFWAILWLNIVTDSPSKHPYISATELTYLNNTTNTKFTAKVNNKVPWHNVLKSAPFWALCAYNWGQAWFLIAMALLGPLYYFHAVNHSVYHASLLTALPFLIRLILGTMTINFYHWYKYNYKNRRINTSYIREYKYFTLLSHILPGIIVNGIWFTSLPLGPIALTLAVSLTAFGMDLAFEICFDLTPIYGSEILTVIRSISLSPGIMVPICVALVTSRYKNSALIWSHIWCFNGVVLWVTGLIFLIWGESKVQPWNKILTGRPYRPHVLPRPSIMSNILETDEEESNRKSRVSQASQTISPASSKDQNVMP